MGSSCNGQGGSKQRVQVSSTECLDPEREKQPACTWLVYRIPFCNDAEVQHLFPHLLRALGALGSRAGWSCLGDLEEAPSPLSKVPDFGLMLVTVSAMVNLRSRTEWEEAGRVRDPTLAQQVLGVLSPGWLPPDSLQSRAEGRASSHESWGSPAKPRPLMAAVDLTASLSPAPSLLQLPPSTCSQSS